MIACVLIFHILIIIDRFYPLKFLSGGAIEFPLYVSAFSPVNNIMFHISLRTAKWNSELCKNFSFFTENHIKMSSFRVHNRGYPARFMVGDNSLLLQGMFTDCMVGITYPHLPPSRFRDLFFVSTCLVRRIMQNPMQ